jgi:uncharacterized protein
LKIQGEHRLNADRGAVWKALQDPRVLASTLPGARRLEVVGPDEYRIAVDIGVGGVKGTFGGTYEMRDKIEEESCMLRGTARGAPGSVRFEAKARLSDLPENGTLLQYDAEATVAGAIAGVGQRMISAATKKTASEFLLALDGVLAGIPGEVGAPEEVTGAPGERPSPERVFAPQRAAAPSDLRTAFAQGVLVGATLTAAGVVLGRWAAR